MFGREPSQDDLSRDVTIVSQKHCWRTLGGIETKNYRSAKVAMSDGCHIQNLTFVLRHPEAMLCDLSNLEEPLSQYSTATIEKLFDEITELTGRILPEEQVRRIHGEDLRPEIAVSAASKAVANAYKTKILNIVLAKRQGSERVIDTQSEARGIAKSRLIIESSPNTQEIYNSFCAYYGRYIASTYWASSSALNQATVYDDHVVWSQIESLGDNKLFIISAGLSIGLGYAETTGDSRLFFTEVHRQNDPSILQRHGPFDRIYPEPSKSPASWVVIDKAYTGGSIRHAKGRLRRELGHDTRITTVALFPKSLEAVAGSDYVVYAGRLIRVKEVIPRLTYADWHLQLLRAGAT